MSQTKIHSGILKPMNVIGKNLEEKCRLICHIENVDKIPHLYYSWKETLESDFRKKYVVLNEEIYMYLYHEEIFDESYYSKMIQNSDGTIGFFAIFDNGGTCIEEMLEDEIKNIK